MQEYPSSVMKNQWGQIADAALREPVTITKHGRASHVVMSNHEYQALKKAVFVAEVKAKLVKGIEAADNGEFSTLSLDEMKMEARRRLEAKQGENGGV